MANSDAKIPHNPWNGLRTYIEGEIIYGRNEEIQILSLQILQNNQTVVYGRSGIGKSSILNAGIFPIAREHGVFPVYVRFEHNAELSYLQQIKCAIKREIDNSNGEIIINEIISETDNETLWEFFHRIEYRNQKGNLIKPLIVFDQFEEIFTLENSKAKINLFFRQLADLINNVMPEEVAAKATIANTLQKNDELDSGTLDLGLGLLKHSQGYNMNSDYHLVFTLREDFLSYFERNTTDIPALKNNRYCLQPINDEQAAEIITQPLPGLVDVKVAKLIIEKVTGETDFEIDGIPEIQVDSAVLSLYLSRLYDKMISECNSKITADLVEAYSANIIEDFYSDAIRGLPTKSVNWLEDTLINSEGRRDNRDKSTVLKESGLSLHEIQKLTSEVKLLRQFSYGGNLRIEYIHDIIAPVVMQHRREREALKHQRKMRRRNILLMGCTGVLMLALIGFIIAYFRPNDDLNTYVITLREDNTINMNEYWQAKLKLIDDGDILVDTVLDKSNPTFAFKTGKKFTTPPKIDINFLIGNLKIDSCNYSDSEKNNINIKISQNSKRKLVEGVVFSNVGSRAPVYDALIIIDDQVTKSNYRGEFKIYVDESYNDSIIRIIKNGYDVFENKFNNNNKYRLKYNKEYTFYREAKRMESIVNNSSSKFSLKGRIYSYVNGKKKSGDAQMFLTLRGDSIYGYMYYTKSFQRESNRYNSYFLIKGMLDPSSDSFKMDMVDAVSNKVNYEGVKNDNAWAGNSFYKQEKVSYFNLSKD